MRGRFGRASRDRQVAPGARSTRPSRDQRGLCRVGAGHPQRRGGPAGRVRRHPSRDRSLRPAARADAGLGPTPAGAGRRAPDRPRGRRCTAARRRVGSPGPASGHVADRVRAGERAKRRRMPNAIVSLSKDAGAVGVELAPLSEEAVSELVESALGGPVELAVRRWVSLSSAGNALYVRELLLSALREGWLAEVDGLWRLAAQPPPSRTIVQLIASRMEEMGEQERRVIELLSLGEPLALAEVARLTGSEAIAGAEAHGLVTVGDPARGGEVRLAHPLYGEAVRASLSVVQTREDRLRLAALLGERPNGGPTTRCGSRGGSSMRARRYPPSCCSTPPAPQPCPAMPTSAASWPNGRARREGSRPCSCLRGRTSSARSSPRPSGCWQASRRTFPAAETRPQRSSTSSSARRRCSTGGCDVRMMPTTSSSGRGNGGPRARGGGSWTRSGFISPWSSTASRA